MKKKKMALWKACVAGVEKSFCIIFKQTGGLFQKRDWELQSNQVKRTPQEAINEFIIQKLNPLLVVDFRLISAFLNV